MRPMQRQDSLGLRHGRRLRRLFARLGRGIFGRAFGLNLAGMKDSIATVHADGQRLRIVFKRVGRRIAAGVVDRKLAALLNQNELRMCAVALY